MVAQLRISLGLDSAAFDTGVRNANQQINALGINMQAARSNFGQFEQGFARAGQSAVRMGGQLQQAEQQSGLMRAGLQNLGFQLQDIAVQFASGGHAGTIFAQQLPQAAGAMTMIAQATGKTSGLLGAFASFMGGPWGVAVGVGAAVLSPLIAKLFTTGNAAEKSAGQVDTLAASLARLRTTPMEELGSIQGKVLTARGALRNAEAMPRYTGGGSDAYKRNTYLERERQRAIDAVLNGDGTDANPGLRALEMRLKVAQDLSSRVYPKLFDLKASAGRVKAKDIKLDDGEDGGGGSKGGRSGRKSQAQAADETAQAYDRLLAVVSPGTAELDKFKSSMADLAKVMQQGVLTPETGKAWEAKLREAVGIGPDGLTAITAITGGKDDLDARVAKVTDSLSKISLAANDNASKTIGANARVQDSFETMAQNVIGALQGMASSIQSGGFIGVLSSLLNLGLQLGGIGAFGKSVQLNIKGMQAHAEGTMFSPGGLALVGERGPELVNLPRGSRVWKNGTGPSGGGGNVYNFRGNLMTPEFFAQIQRGNVAAAQAGGELGYRKVMRSSSRRLG